MDNNYTIVRHLGIKCRSDCYLIKYADGRQGILLRTLYQGELLERNITNEHKVQAFMDFFDRISRTSRRGRIMERGNNHE